MEGGRQTEIYYIQIMWKISIVKQRTSFTFSKLQQNTSPDPDGPSGEILHLMNVPKHYIHLIWGHCC